MLSPASPLTAVIAVIAYIAASCCLIAFNKYLISPGRFPHALALVTLHMAFASAALLGLRCCGGHRLRAALFPSLERSDVRDAVLGGVRSYMASFGPIGIAFAAVLVLSNTAYLHSSIAFLQLMKEANLVFIYLGAIMLGLNHFSWPSLKVVIFITLATTVSIAGELHFAWVGFVLQLSAQCSEVVKLLLQDMLLSSRAINLDVLSFVTLMCPAVLGALLAASAVFPDESIFRVGSVHLIKEHATLLTCNCFVSLLLNVAVAWTIKCASSVGFMLAGICKDIAMVLLSAAVFEQGISALQTASFACQVGGILAWSLLQMFPQHFDQIGVAHGCIRLLCFSDEVISTRALVKSPAAVADTPDTSQPESMAAVPARDTESPRVVDVEEGGGGHSGRVRETTVYGAVQTLPGEDSQSTAAESTSSGVSSSK